MHTFAKSGLAVNLARQQLAQLWGRPLYSDRTRTFFVAALLECLPPTPQMLYHSELDTAKLCLIVLWFVSRITVLQLVTGIDGHKGRHCRGVITACMLPPNASQALVTTSIWHVPSQIKGVTDPALQAYQLLFTLDNCE